MHGLVAILTSILAAPKCADTLAYQNARESLALALRRGTWDIHIKGRNLYGKYSSI